MRVTTKKNENIQEKEEDEGKRDFPTRCKERRQK